MTLNTAMMSSDRGDWQTPPHVLRLVHDVFDGGIDTDPATSPDNPTGASWFFTAQEDGLDERNPWRGNVFVNPPYGRGIGAWVDRAEKAMGRRQPATAEQVIMLLPARTDTKWFAPIFHHWDAICFVSGRLTFVGAPSCAPFPSAIAYMGRWRHRFANVFSSIGWVVRP